MNIKLSDKEVLFIYLHFNEHLTELKELKKMPNCPVSKTNINQDIKLYSSIISKIEAECPQFKVMPL